MKFRIILSCLKCCFFMNLAAKNYLLEHTFSLWDRIPLNLSLFPNWVNQYNNLNEIIICNRFCFFTRDETNFYLILPDVGIWGLCPRQPENIKGHSSDAKRNRSLIFKNIAWDFRWLKLLEHFWAQSMPWF